MDAQFHLSLLVVILTTGGAVVVCGAPRALPGTMVVDNSGCVRGSQLIAVRRLTRVLRCESELL